MAQTSEFVDFISKKQEDHIKNDYNFISKIDNYIAPLGLDETKINSLKANILAYIDACNEKNALKAKTRAATKKCQELLKPLNQEIRATKKDAELSPNCTESILEDLGMNNTRRIIEMDNDFPKLNVELVAGLPEIKYKKTPYDGIRLTCIINKGESTNHETITQNSYKDNSPRITPNQPEVREYSAYFLKKGKIVGQQSKKVKIILESI